MSLSFHAVVKGYHVYRMELNPNVLYHCYPEPTNAVDRRAVAVRGGGHMVGHVPKQPAQLNELFLELLEMDKGISIEW